MRAKPTALLAVLLLLPLAGCLGSSSEPTENPTATGANGTPDDPAVDTTDPMQETGTGGAGSRAHRHDYWAGRTEVVLFDGEVQSQFPCGWIRPERTNDGLRGGCYLVQMGNGTIVYQGTEKLTVLATWSDPKVTGLSFVYQDAQAFHEDPTPVASGVPIEIPVTLESADMAHSKESKWEFRFLGGAEGHGVALGPVHITLTIHRGLNLPVDPPHPDFWGAKTVLELANFTTTVKPESGDFLIFISEFESVGLPEGVIVPPGTTKLEVHYTYRVKDPAPGVSYWVLPGWKSAQGPFWTLERGNRAEGTGEGHYEIDVEPAMTDSPYATTSQWRFAFLQTQNEPTTGMELPLSYFGTSPLNRELEVTLSLIAHGGHDMSAMEQDAEA